MQVHRALLILAALMGCGGARAGAELGAEAEAGAGAGAAAGAEAGAGTEAGAEAEAALPDHCVALTAAGGSGVLSAELVRVILDETSAVLADVTCTCARAHGVHTSARIRLRLVAVPGRGAIDHASAAYESGDHQPRDWRGFQSCVERDARTAELPVHVIGSDVVPDPDPTDERVSFPMWIDLH